MARQWLPIEDFAGIWTAPGNGFAGGLQAPVGAAQAADTYRCVPGPGGKGLYPGPGYVNSTSFAVSALSEGAAIATANLYINAYNSFRTATTRGSADYIGVTYRTTTPALKWKLLSVIEQAASAYLVVTATAGSSTACMVGAGLVSTRMNPTTPYVLPGQPVMGYSIPWSDLTGRLFGVTPNPTAPGNNNLNLGGATNGGNILGHQNRLVLLEDSTYTVNGGGIALLSLAGEEISYTDPANSNIFPGGAGTSLQRQVFYPENPTGYGAWGSLSASALLLVKRYGGAILVEGDIAAPRVTYLPGVQSTGRVASEAGVTALGVVYASDRAGIWAWNGATGSEKLSMQLDDYCYRNGSNATIYDNDTGGSQVSGLFGGPTFQALQWGEYILCSADWMYHIATKTWWRLDDISSRDHLFYREAYTPYSIVASKVRTASNSGTQDYADNYSKATPATSWSFRFQPIVITTDTDVEVTEIVVVAMRDTSGTGTSTITITLYNADGTTQALPAKTITASARPQRVRFPCKMLGDVVDLKIVAANSSTAPAPAVLSVAIGWDASNLAPVG